MTQSSNSIAGTQPSAGISAVLTNSAPTLSGLSFEAEVLSALQSSLDDLAVVPSGSRPTNTAAPTVNTTQPKSSTSLVPRAQPAPVESAQAASIVDSTPAAATTASTIATAPQPGTNQSPAIGFMNQAVGQSAQTSSGANSAAQTFLGSFKPTYENPTSQVVDVTGTVVGQVPLNPYLFATQETADQLASLLGAKVVVANVSGGPVQRNVVERELQFDGAPDALNAGLVAHEYELARESGESVDFVNARLQAEIEASRRDAAKQIQIS